MHISAVYGFKILREISKVPVAISGLEWEYMYFKSPWLKLRLLGPIIYSIVTEFL